MAADDRFREIWLQAENGSMLCALINGNLGLLMYLPTPDDPGFSSRNPDYAGAASAMIAYRLSNGQEDQYPASWALPIGDVELALAYFRERGKAAPLFRRDLRPYLALDIRIGIAHCLKHPSALN